MKMKLHILKKIFSISAALTVTVLSLGCDNQFAFQEIQVQCVPPRTSARYGKNKGPVIVLPAENTPFNGSMTVAGTCENGYDVVLRGSGLDGEVETACSNGEFRTTVTFKSGDGVKELDIAQATYNGEDIVDRRCFLQDTIPPKVVIAGHNGSQAVGGRTIRVQGTCETGLPVQIEGPQLSAPVTVTCQNGRFNADIAFTGGDGLKDIVARQEDRAGNRGHDDGRYLTDNTPPVVTITSPSPLSISKGNITVTGTCESGPRVLLQGDLTGTLNVTDCAEGRFSLPLTLSSGDGVKHVTATQTDVAGNTGSASRDFTKDATAPSVRITSPSANSYIGQQLTLVGSCETGLIVQMSGDGLNQLTTSPCSNGAFTAHLNTRSGDGVKSITAFQTDPAGNTGSDSRSFLRDNTPPVVTILQPAARSTWRSSLTLQGSCESGLQVLISGPGASSPVATSCSAGTYLAVVTLSTGDGSKELTATQTDAAGNTHSASRAFVRDSTPPAITITSPAEDFVSRTELLLRGTCENGLSVQLSGPGLSTPSTTPCANGAFQQTVLFSNGDGFKNINAAQTDTAGNIGTSSRRFIRDNTAPAVAIVSPPANTSSATGLTITGTCESGLVVNISGDVNVSSTVPCTSGAFTAAVVFSAGLGTKNITVTQTDLADNVGSSTRAFVKSNNAGYDTFISKGPSGKVDILFVNDNSASMESEQAALGSRFSSFTSALSGLDWHVGMVTSDCTEGSPHNFCGQLFDMVGQAPGQYYLTPSSPNYLASFRNTIQRPETRDCLLTSTCPSGREEGLRSTIEAMNRRRTDNVGFFRDDADLAVVMLTDEDEASNAPPSATTPQQVVQAFQSIWGTNKKFSSYGIIVRPGDATCWNTQRAQLGNNANYGTYPALLAALTGGLTVSICEPDYSLTLTQIGENVTRLSRSVDLSQTPINGTVTVVFTPAHSTTWSISGRRVTFDRPAPVGTRIEIFYEY